MVFSSISDTVLNFRKLKQDFSSGALREGKSLFEKGAVRYAEIADWADETVILNTEVEGQFQNIHTCSIELLRHKSEIIFSSCDCTERVDCQHITCSFFYAEKHFSEMLIRFLQKREGLQSQNPSLDLDQEVGGIPEGAEENLGKSGIDRDISLKVAEKKSKERVKEAIEKEYIDGYTTAGQWLAKSTLCSAHIADIKPIEQAEMSIAIGALSTFQQKQHVELQVVIKIPGKQKLIHIQQPKFFFQGLFLGEPLVLGVTRSLLIDDSFGERAHEVLSTIREQGEVIDKVDKDGKLTRVFTVPYEAMVVFISKLVEIVVEEPHAVRIFLLPDIAEAPYIISSHKGVVPSFHIEIMTNPIKAIHVDVLFDLENLNIKLRELKLFPAKSPFLLHNTTLYRIDESLHIKHLLDLESIGSILFPEPLFPTFFLYALPSFERYGPVILTKEVKELLKLYSSFEPLAPCATIPKVRVDLSRTMQDELSLRILFLYEQVGGLTTQEPLYFPEIHQPHSLEHLNASVSLIDKKNSHKNRRGIARNVYYERVVSQEISWGFVYDEKKVSYIAKSDKKAVEFFADVIPFKLSQVEWCFDEAIEPLILIEKSVLKIHVEALLNQQTQCRIRMTVSGSIVGLSGDAIIDAYRQKRFLIDTGKKIHGVEGLFGLKTSHVLLSPDVLADLVELVQDMMIPQFSSEESWIVPLWMVFGLEKTMYPHLDISFSRDKEVDLCIDALSHFSEQGESEATAVIQQEENQRYQLRSYQKTGIEWMSMLQKYGLSGILADDMGLGKTLQTIVLLSKIHGMTKEHNKIVSSRPISLIVCPTSLVENWKEEFVKFEPGLKILLFSGTPGDRKKMAATIQEYDVVVTSYSILQREIEFFEQSFYTYVILDEAQTIKNRDTRNARTVKKLKALHRLALTGTPIENSLEDIWSIFDFLMPGLLGSFDRFCQNYMRQTTRDFEKALLKIRKRIQPFVLRRMKQNVLDDLPPITHQTYYSTFKENEKIVYEQWARKARDEIEERVARDGFDKSRLHVLALLSKLKQFCCHPDLVTQDSGTLLKSEGSLEEETLGVLQGAKYELLHEIVDTLVASNRKTVIFSQYTRMLQLMKHNFENKGIRLLYLDGSTKNRVSLVKQFNEDSSIHLFLVSLKAGGTGLNLVGADTVIHYDPWWNPAVENQATDRVWRMGQKTNVSSYKLIVRGSIEEKIAQLQENKKELISDLIQNDEELLGKLNYEDVLSILKDII